MAEKDNTTKTGGGAALPVDPTVAALIGSLLSSLGGGSAKNTESTTIAADKVQINPAAAKALLDVSMAEIGFTGKLSSKDLNEFVNQFNAEAARQIEKAIRTTKEETTGGTTPEEVRKNKTQSVTTKILSYFDPKQFARDYLWAKVNFKKEEGLPTTAAEVIGRVRSLAKDYNLNMVSDVELLNEAKNVATGKKKLEDLQVEFGQKAATYYPLYSERIKLNPNATLRELNQPAINILAKTLEIDPTQINLDDPLLERFTRPDGLIGKAQQPTLAELQMAAMNDSRFDRTTTAINMGRDSAIAFARAMGYSI